MLYIVNILQELQILCLLFGMVHLPVDFPYFFILVNDIGQVSVGNLVVDSFLSFLEYLLIDLIQRLKFLLQLL